MGRGTLPNELALFAHYSGLTLMKDFDIDEAQHEFLLLKKELRPLQTRLSAL
jgi:hypothetical protein